MFALIMAGGSGSRLNMGEKPLVTICGRPMISYVIDAFRLAGTEVVIILTPRTPFTQNWCRAQGEDTLTTAGIGYVEDLGEAVLELEIHEPFFSSVADLPCLQAPTIRTILSSFHGHGKEACSTWIPTHLRAHYLEGYEEIVDGVTACAVGVNILTGFRINEPQDEYRLLLHDPDLAYNINTREDLAAVERFLCRRKQYDGTGKSTRLMIEF